MLMWYKRRTWAQCTWPEMEISSWLGNSHRVIDRKDIVNKEDGNKK